MGKERGYLLYDEVNDILPAEVHSSEEIDDLLSTFERYGIDIYEDLSSAKAALRRRGCRRSRRSRDRRKKLPVAKTSDLDLTPGTLEKTNDPVRMYLREMGTVPLLTREGEVAIAKRIERGQLLVLKTITRAPLILKELLQVGEDLRNGTRSIKEIVQFDDEELTEEKIETKTKKRSSRSTRSPSSTSLALKQAREARADAASRRSAPICTRATRWRALRIEMSQLRARARFQPASKRSA